MRAREPQIHSAEPLFYSVQVRANALAHAVSLAGNLLLVWDDASGTSEVHEYRPTLHALNDSANYLSLLLAKFFHHRELFSFAHFLYHYLLRSLCGDTPEVVLRFKREYYFFAERYAALDELRVREKNVLFSIKSRQLAFGEMLFFTMK